MYKMPLQFTNNKKYIEKSNTIYNKYRELFNIDHNKTLLRKYISDNIDNGKGLFSVIFYIEIIGEDRFIINILKNIDKIFTG